MTNPDDIVARLRSHIATTTRLHYAKDGFSEPVYVSGPSPICQEAADEIERLRAERDELLSQRNQLRAEVVDRALRINHPVCWDINSPTRKRCEKYARLRGWHDLWNTVNEQERLLREEASQ